MTATFGHPRLAEWSDKSVSDQIVAYKAWEASRFQFTTITNNQEVRNKKLFFLFRSEFSNLMTNPEFDI